MAPWVSSCPGNGFKHVLVPTEEGVALQTRDAEGRPLEIPTDSHRNALARPGLFRHVSAPQSAGADLLRDKGVYVGIGNRLVLVTAEPTPQILKMPGGVQGLCGSTPYSVGRIVATLEEGALLIWEDDQTMARFAEGLNHPLAAFTTSGWIVLASSEELRVFKAVGRKIQLAARQPRNVPPVAVLATADPDGFAIVGQDGTVEIYQMSRR